MAVTDTDMRALTVDEIGQAGERWKQHHGKAFAEVPDGTSVIINVVSGKYVTAPNWFAARAAYESTFGITPCFSFTVGRPHILGTAPWRR